MLEKEYTGQYKGKDKLGFVNGNEYKIDIKENKNRGYLVLGIYDYTNDCECNIFCPYSSEIMLKRDWMFQ